MKHIVIVDAQNDFITGSLGSKEAVAAAANIAAYFSAHAEGARLYITQDTHYGDYAGTQEGRRLPVPHCTFGTPGRDIDPGILSQIPAASALWYAKETFGCVDLARKLAEDTDRDVTVQICGFCTDICVVANAILIKTFAPEAKLEILADCCAGTTPEKHEAALRVMESCQCDIV